MQGTLIGGRARISAISSQFISALLIACPLAEEDSAIEIEGELKSRPYVDVTLEMLREAGIVVRESDLDLGFLITGGQRFDLKRYTVPGHFSSSPYLLAAGALVDEHVTIQNLYRSAQGDISFPLEEGCKTPPRCQQFWKQSDHFVDRHDPRALLPTC